MPRARTFKLFLIGWTRRLVVFALVVGAALFALSLYVGRTRPTWYEPPPPDDTAVGHLADRVEYAIIEEAKKIRPDAAPWTLRIREHQINAWLGTRLRAWIAHEQDVDWPAELGTPQMHLIDGQFMLALPVGPPGRQRVTVSTVSPTIKDGSLRLRLTSVALGRLRLPGDPVETLSGLLREVRPGRNPRDWQGLLDILAGRRGVEPILELDDGRTVEVLAIRCHEGAVDLTSRTILDEGENVENVETSKRQNGETGAGRGP